jgi:ketosteroid isomerase-like protein
MIKNLSLLILCCFMLQARAQDVKEVISSEQAFAAYSRDYNTKDAFLKFMDSTGLVFNNGEPKNAIADWSARRAGPAKLLWEPTFAGIAASGDIGFTTGPWQLKKTMQDTAVAAGMFTSVWRKTAHGDWKNIVDMGYGFDKLLYKADSVTISKAGGKSAKADAMAIEQQFLDKYNKQGRAAFNEVLTTDSWLNMNGLQPFTTQQQHAGAIAALPAGLVMKPLGGGLSAAKDIAYVYGVVEYNNQKQNYLRVWKQTAAGWKIALQVIQW